MLDNAAGRVLVVEDDAPIRLLVGRSLQRAGFTIDEAEDGAIAIEKLQNEKYAVIVLDLMMPRVDGFGVLAYMKDNSAPVLTKVIIATAMPMAELRARLSVEVCDILTKPFDIENLIRVARRCAEKNVEEPLPN